LREADPVKPDLDIDAISLNKVGFLESSGPTKHNTLLYQYYEASNNSRQDELDECLTENLNISFEHIVVCGDRRFETSKKNVVFASHGRRLTFGKFLDFVNQNGDLDGLAVLTNSDIALDAKFLEKISTVDADTVLCISRYEANGKLVESPWCSQDTWVMRFQKVREPLRMATNVYLGSPGCELRFAEAMYSAGYKVFNPCLSIVNRHIHSQPSTHEHSDRHYGAYVFTPPCTIEDVVMKNSASEGYPVYLRFNESLKQISVR
jgi:hypothetical protein